MCWLKIKSNNWVENGWLQIISNISVHNYISCESESSPIEKSTNAFLTLSPPYKKSLVLPPTSICFDQKISSPFKKKYTLNIYEVYKID